MKNLFLLLKIVTSTILVRWCGKVAIKFNQSFSSSGLVVKEGANRPSALSINSKQPYTYRAMSPPFLNDSEDDCNLVDGYALLVQFAVGCVAISTLLLKRFLEWPRRPWLVWFFDASKQAIASSTMHLTNVLAAYLSERRAGDEGPDQCVWYLTSILIDGTLLLTLVASLVLLQGWWADRTDLKTFRPGEYGNPPKWSIWVQQLTLYCLFLFGSKAICLWVLHQHGTLYRSLAAILMSPFLEYRRVELLIVMVGIPGGSAILQYWLMDNLLKANWRSLWIRRVTEGWQWIPPGTSNGNRTENEEEGGEESHQTKNGDHEEDEEFSAEPVTNRVISKTESDKDSAIRYFVLGQSNPSQQQNPKDN
jgi:hypothetical protein